VQTKRTERQQRFINKTAPHIRWRMPFGTSEIMFIFKYGGMPMKAAEKSMQLFARDVMPALQELHPQPMLAEAA